MVTAHGLLGSPSRCFDAFSPVNVQCAGPPVAIMSKHDRSFDKAFEEEASALKQPQLKPFETPKGYVPPTLGEQFRYVRLIDAPTRVVAKRPRTAATPPHAVAELCAEYPFVASRRHTLAILTPTRASEPLS